MFKNKRIKIATPISHLFDNSSTARQIIEHSDCLECRDNTINATLDNQELFHCNLQPIHVFDKKDFQYLERIAIEKSELKLVTFHAASSCNKPFMKEGIFQTGGDEYSKKDMIENSKKKF